MEKPSNVEPAKHWGFFVNTCFQKDPIMKPSIAIQKLEEFLLVELAWY